MVQKTNTGGRSKFICYSGWIAAGILLSSTVYLSIVKNNVEQSYSRSVKAVQNKLPEMAKTLSSIIEQGNKDSSADSIKMDSLSKIINQPQLSSKLDTVGMALDRMVNQKNNRKHKVSSGFYIVVEKHNSEYKASENRIRYD